MRRLEGDERNALHAAMGEAFADFDDVDVFARLRLEVDLAEVTERAKKPVALLRLIDHAERRGLLPQLADGLAADYGGNASVAAIVARLRAPAVSSAPPRAPSAAPSGAAPSSTPTVAAPSTSPVLCTLPPYEDVRFVGRVKELAALDAWGAGDRRVLVLHGPPGVGKTRLAVEWAHRQAGAFPGGRYFLSFRADPHGALHEVARLRGVRREPDERLDEWAIRALHHVGAERALVIFDDLQSVAEFAVWFGHLSTARAIVVTNEKVWPTGYTKIPVDVLEVGDARELAYNVIGDEAVAAQNVEDIVARSGRNAVQIMVDAGALHDAVVLGDLPSLLPVPAPEALESFERAWRTATDDARTMVCVLALYRAQGTPTARVAEVLGADGWEEARTRKALSEAVRRHLVARDAKHALSLHPLLRTFARSKAPKVLTAATHEAHARAFVAKARAFAERPGERTKYDEVAHDESDLVVWDARAPKLSPDDRMVVGEALREVGRFAEARRWYERAAEMRQGDVLGCVDRQSLGATLHEVGVCFSSLGQFAEARSWYEHAAEELRHGDVLGRVDHALLGRSLHQVGVCLSSLGQFAEARGWYEHAAEEKRQGDVHCFVDHQSLGSTLHQVGFCLSSHGQFAEARGWYEHAAAEMRQGDVLGRVDHQTLGSTLHQVGFCLWSQRQFAEARGWYEHAADEMRQGDVHGRINHASLGWTTYRMALCISALEQFTDARAWYERAADEMRQGDIFGRVNAAQLATCLEALADTLDRLDLADDARPHREEAAQLRASLPKP